MLIILCGGNKVGPLVEHTDRMYVLPGSQYGPVSLIYEVRHLKGRISPAVPDVDVLFDDHHGWCKRKIRIRTISTSVERWYWGSTVGNRQWSALW